MITNTFTVKGYYGSQHTPCNVIIATMYNGLNWYCVEGSQNVNCTFEPIELGVDVETLSDFDYFYHSSPIESESELESAIES